MAKDVFGRDAGTYGALSAMLALGALGGALLGARRTRPRIAVMLGAALAFGASEIVVGLAPTLPVFALLLVPTGALMITFASTANSLVQLSAGEEIRGRVMALYSLVFLGGTPIGAPVIGWLAEHFGARSGLILGGGVSVLLTVVIAGALLSGESREALRHPRSVLRELRTGLSPTPEALR
jgi:MFS family permease